MASQVAINGHNHTPPLPGRPSTASVPRYEIVPARTEHVYSLCDNLRDQDRREIENIGVTVKRALYRAVRNSILCKAAIMDAKVVAMWGLGVGLRPGVSPLSDLGVPWLHTAAAIEAIPVSFVKVAKRELALMRSMRPRLESFVTADYAQAIKFLRLLGFTVEKPQPVGLNGTEYCRFHIGFDA